MARRHIAAWVLPLLVAGCLGAAPPADTFYGLRVPEPAGRLSAPALQGVLEVERLRSDALGRERNLLRLESVDGVEVSPYGYHLWVDPPPVLLQRALAEHLRQAGVADEVVLPEMRAAETWEINGFVTRFAHVVGGPERVVFDVEFSVVRSRTGEILLRRSYRVVRDVDGSGPGAAATALGLAAGEAFDRLEADLAARGG